MDAGRVLVIGEAIMDVVDGVPTPGGSAANVALGLARRGIQVQFATHVAADKFGKAILGRLAGAGVEIVPGSVSAPRTSTARATVRASGDVSYSFDVGWAMPQLGSVGRVDVVHVGSVPAFSTDGRAELLDRLTSRIDGCVTFDPNIRPALAPPRQTALEQFREIAGIASIVKLSDDDAAWLYPARPLREVAVEVLRLGPRLTVITRAAEGATLSSADAEMDVAAAPANVKDTIGAGDTVMVSLIASHLAGRDETLDSTALRDIGERAAREAAITVSRIGADMPMLADLRAPTGIVPS